MKDERRGLSEVELFWLFLVLGILGLINIASQTFLDQSLGVVSVSIAYVLGLLFGIQVASLVGTILELVMGLALIWLILAVYFKIKIKKAVDSKQS